MMTGSRWIIVDVLTGNGREWDAAEMARTASTEIQHRAASQYHRQQAERNAGTVLGDMHDSAMAQHLAAADRPKIWQGFSDQSYSESPIPISIARVQEEGKDHLSHAARNASLAIEERMQRDPRSLRRRSSNV